jgi:hypothetical protein
MRVYVVTAVLAAGCLVSSVALAQVKEFDGPRPRVIGPAIRGEPEAKPADPNNPTAPAAEESAVDVPRKAPVDLGPKYIRLNLLDGSVISGDLSVSEITVETPFGNLVVPIDRIKSFTPGLDSYPKVLADFEELVKNLGSDDYQTREQAHKDLAGMGVKVRKELDRFVNDENAEIKRHVGEIIKEIEEQNQDADAFEEGAGAQAWIRLDTVVTSDFTVVGKVTPKQFEIASKYGPLTVQLADVAKGERDTGVREALRKSMTVEGTHIAQRSFKSTGIRLQAGDKVTVRADGNVIMSPWGSNAATGPDGAPNYGWYVANQIPGGALVGRVGDKGQIFKVGRQSTFTAKSAGVLQLAIGIQPEYANEGYQYPGQYNVKLKVEPK